MKFLSMLCLLAVNTIAVGQASKHMVNTERGSLHSKILSMEKFYQVFLPESYNYSNQSNYPVAYIIDGDYNFYYQSGVIESLASVSEKIPEMIVVGISDNGNAGYRLDCTMPSTVNPNGNAKNFMRYLEEELKPKIEQEYRVSSYDVLIGHSLGGLFATNVLLEKPKLFSAYIAIDPSYWWDDYEIVSRADSLIDGKAELGGKLFVSLADTKQMGVHQFVGVLEKHLPDAKNWTYKHYEDENHGSVGLISVRDGLLNIFEDWLLTREQFYQMESSAEVMNYYKKLAEKYDTKFRLPPNLFANIINYYHRTEKAEDLSIIEETINTSFLASADDYYSKLASYNIAQEKYDESESMLLKYIHSNDKAYKSHDALSKLYLKKDDLTKAKTHAEKAIAIAKSLVVRQWQLNELESNLTMIANQISSGQ